MSSNLSTKHFKAPQSPKKWKQLFFDSCQSGNLAVVKKLCRSEFKSIADIHAENERGFQWACKYGHFEIVKFLTTSPELLDAGHTWVNIHADNEYGFRLACYYSHFEIVKFLTTSKELIKAGHTFADLHANDELGFRRACGNGHLEVVKFLTTSPDVLEAGHTFVDIHAENEQGFQLACENSQAFIIQFLIFELKIERTPTINTIVKKYYPQAQELFRVREEQEQIQQSFESRSTLETPTSQDQKINSVASLRI